MILFKILAVFLISFIIVGCIYVPTPEHGYSYMKEVTKDMVEQLEPGTTTKDDVILLLGKPTYVERNSYSTYLEHGIYSDDEVGDFEKFFCYRWMRKDGYWVDMGGGVSSPVVQHSFCLEFTLNGKLKRFKHFERDWSIFADKKEIPEQERDWKDEEN
jgi:hypothetical protein